MNKLSSLRHRFISPLAILALFILIGRGAEQAGHAQQIGDQQTGGVGAALSPDSNRMFRFERVNVAGGAELLTVWGRVADEKSATANERELPLVSVLRDTLGDDIPENDRLRYLWTLAYTRPTVLQRAAAAVPFLYQRVNNKSHAKTSDAPPAIMDLSETEGVVWRDLFFTGIKLLLVDQPAARASINTYRRNISDYRKVHVMRALAILALYQAQTGAAPALSPSELQDIQARLMLTEKSLGGIVSDSHLQSYYLKHLAATRDYRGHNWELLRQRAEAEGLYYEPLEMPDGSVTHAMLWVSRANLRDARKREFHSRFLNIKNPWSDKRLQRWSGYTETRYFNDDHQRVDADAAGAHAEEMIPLALYGLDYPKIPVLLVDFRDSLNPKGREMSRRILDDVARNVLQVSRFGDMYYFLGRTAFDFVTGRRGMDINQPSRLRTYSQLKLLLSLSESFAPQLRDEINERIENVSLDPLENDSAAERNLARDQYRALLAYAARPDGLPARLAKDRRAELVAANHGVPARVVFRAANIASLGLYTHREPEAADNAEQLSGERQIAYHLRFLREVAQSSPLIEVVWNIEDVRRSLRYVAEHTATQRAASGDQIARTTAKIYARTEDSEIRQLCVEGLRKINTETAKNELARLHVDNNTAATTETMTRLRAQPSVGREEGRGTSNEIKTFSSVVDHQ